MPLFICTLQSNFHDSVSRVRLVKPENARAVEDVIIRNAQSGNIRGKYVNFAI